MNPSNSASALEGLMMRPQNFSVNDGEGIRTVLFFAKCPLRCKWCANPECFTETDTNDFVRKYGIQEILDIIDKQKIFYRHSGGGVTFSGGEALVQHDLLDTLSSKLYDDGLSLALETSGFFNFEKAYPILKRMDLIFVDIKALDPDLHKAFTGQDNLLILENIKKLNGLEAEVVIRVPVIEGANASLEAVAQIAGFVKETVNPPKIELLPYHTLGHYKYEKLGIQPPGDEFKTPSSEKMKALEDCVRNEGVQIVRYV